jgi:hypothetical protein
MWESFVIWTLVAAAFVWVGAYLWRLGSGKGGGCAGCKGSCGGADAGPCACGHTQPKQAEESMEKSQ